MFILRIWLIERIIHILWNENPNFFEELSDGPKIMMILVLQIMWLPHKNTPAIPVLKKITKQGSTLNSIEVSKFQKWWPIE